MSITPMKPISLSNPIGEENRVLTTSADPGVAVIASVLSPKGENSYLQVYPHDIAFRIQARDNFLLPNYKAGFRNLVTLVVPPNMPLEEAELLLHDIAAMTPEQRESAYNLLKGPLFSIITRDNYHDFLQTLLSNSALTDQTEQSFVKAALQLVKPEIPGAENIKIIKMLLVLISNHPDRLNLIEPLTKEVIAPHLIPFVLNMILEPEYLVAIDRLGLPKLFEQLNEIASLINPKEFEDVSAQNMGRNMLAVIKIMNIQEHEKQQEIKDFAQKRQVSLNTLLGVVRFSDRRNLGDLSIVDRILPSQVDERFLNILLTELSRSDWFQLNKTVEPNLIPPLRALLDQRPAISIDTFSRAIYPILDAIEFGEDPHEKIKPYLALPEKELNAASDMPPHPLGDPSEAKKGTGCPFQRMWTLPSISQDPLIMKEMLKYHRFHEGIFNKPPSFTQEIAACSPHDTPRLRKIFSDLLMSSRSERRLQFIVQDHFDHLFRNGIPKDSSDVYSFTFREVLREIARCILDEIPIELTPNLSANLDQDSLCKTSLYAELLSAGYTHEEIIENLKILANLIVENGNAFLRPLLEKLLISDEPAVKHLFVKIRENIQKGIDNGCDIWGAVGKVKEIDMIILETLRMTSLPSIRRTTQTGESIDLEPRLLAKRVDLVGEKPEEFDPTRMDAETKQRISWYWPSAVPWMPFGSGKHVCPAWRLYQVMSRYLVAKVALMTSEQP